MNTWKLLFSSALILLILGIALIISCGDDDDDDNDSVDSDDDNSDDDDENYVSLCFYDCWDLSSTLPAEWTVCVPADSLEECEQIAIDDCEAELFEFESDCTGCVDPDCWPDWFIPNWENGDTLSSEQCEKLIAYEKSCDIDFVTEENCEESWLIDLYWCYLNEKENGCDEYLLDCVSDWW